MGSAMIGDRVRLRRYLSGAAALALLGAAALFAGGVPRVAAYDPPSPSPRSNLLINGAMDIDHGNNGAAVTTNGTYAVDGWLLQYNFTGTVSAQRASASPAPGYANSLKATITSAGTGPGSTEFIALSQKLTGDQITNTAEGTSGAATLSLSLQIKSSVTGTFAVVLRNAAGTRTYVGNCTIASANTWTSCAILIAGDTSGTWTLSGASAQALLTISLETGSNLQTTPWAWQTGNYLATSSQTQLGLTNGATFNVTGVKLEISPAPTPFYRDPIVELSRARYFRRTSYPLGTALGTATASGSVSWLSQTATAQAGGTFIPVQLNPPMRCSPTVTVYSPITGASGKVYESNGAADITGSAGNVGSTGFTVASSGFTPAVGSNIVFHYFADCGL